MLNDCAAYIFPEYHWPMGTKHFLVGVTQIVPTSSLSSMKQDLLTSQKDSVVSQGCKGSPPICHNPAFLVTTH